MRHDTGDPDARDVESWVKTDLTLPVAYRTASQKLSVRKIYVPPTLRVTWIKLVLGRWCMVAASCVDQSTLSFWRIATNGSGPWKMAEVPLEAPVIDGQIDYSTGHVRCAITVGARKPYIMILELREYSDKKVSIEQVGHINDSSHVQVLRGDLIGFAVRGGDDSFPYLANWIADEIHCLQIPPSSIETVFPTGSCKTMSLLNEFVLALHPTCIHVFRLHGDFGSSAAGKYTKYVTSLPFADLIASGQFLHCSRTETAVHVPVLLQDLDSKLAYASLSMDLRQEGAFSLKEYHVRYPVGGGTWRDNCSYFYTPGTSGKVIFTLSPSKFPWRSPNLFWRILEPSTGANVQDDSIINCESIPFDKDNLPVLHLLSCADFDDGHGMLALGTISGDVRIASIVPERIILGSIPEMPNATESIPIQKGFSEVPVKMNLPFFYEVQRHHTLFDRLAPDVTAQLVSEWQDSRIGPCTVGEWTNDWAENRSAWEWITPLPRWGPLDPSYITDSGAAIVRERLQTLGDITPVLYRVANNYEVILRAGQRLYYCRLPRDDEDPDDFEMDDRCILGVLPVTYDQFLADPRTILQPSSDYDIQRNLREWWRPSGVFLRRDIATAAFNILRYLEDKHFDIAEMETWSDDEWDAHDKKAVEFLKQSKNHILMSV